MRPRLADGRGRVTRWRGVKHFFSRCEAHQRDSAATMHHSKFVAHLNHRWRTGGPSDDLNSAGVIVHIPDALGLRREGFVGNASRHGLRILPPRKGPLPWTSAAASESASHCADHAGFSLRVLKPVHSFLVRRRAARSGTTIAASIDVGEEEV